MAVRHITETKVIKLGYSPNGETVVALGVLHNAVAGNDYCNGNIAATQAGNEGACLVDMLYVDDVMAFIKEKGLDKRPEGK